MSKIQIGQVVDLVTMSKAEAKVGDIKYSMLTEAQFNAEHLGQWIIADGRNVAGSDFHAIAARETVPDLRGMFLRGKNNGRADGWQNPYGDLALGTLQNDMFQGHFHAFGWNLLSNQGGSSTRNGATYDGNYNGIVRQATNDGVNGDPRTGVETRPKNVTVNIFIKINY